MTDVPVAAVAKILDDAWSVRAWQILQACEKDGHFSTFSITPGSGAVFAFMREEGDLDSAIGVLTHVSYDRNDYHRTFGINYMGVLRGHRRAGVAKALFEKAHELAAQDNCTEIDVRVNSFNYPMLRFAQKIGFDPEPVQLLKRIEQNRRSEDWEFA